MKSARKGKNGMARSKSSLRGPSKSTGRAKASANGVGHGVSAKSRAIEFSSSEEESEEESEELDSEEEDAMSGYDESEESEEEEPATGKKQASTKAALAHKAEQKRRVVPAKKAAASKAAGHGKSAAGSAGDSGADCDDPEEEVGDESVYVCTKNGGGRDGPLNILVPGANHSSWNSKDFCLLVHNNWRRDGGFHLLEVDPKSRKVLERAGGRECNVSARLWYCSKELEPKRGFDAGKHGFLPLSKGFKPWVLPGGSWLPVNAVQRARVKVEKDYKDSDEGILSLKKGELASASGEEANGWAQIRTDTGEEGWFPAGYVTLIRKYVEIEEEEDKVIFAYNLLPPRDCDKTKQPGKSEKHDKKTPAKQPGSKSKVGRSAGEDEASKGGRSGAGGEGGRPASSNYSFKELDRACSPSYSDLEEERKEYSRRNRRTTDRFSPTWEEEEAARAAEAADDIGKKGQGSGGDPLEPEHRSRSRENLARVSQAMQNFDGHELRTPSQTKKRAAKEEYLEEPVKGGSSTVRRRRSKEQEGDGEHAMACGVCYNPNKKLGNARTITLLCNRCEGLIRQGWPYYQHRNPKNHEPGHAVTITNLCIHCWKSADQQDGYYEPQSHDDMSTSAPSNTTPSRDAGGGSGSKGATKTIQTSAFEERVVQQKAETLCNCVFCGQVYHERCILYHESIYGNIPPRCPNPACVDKWEALYKPEANMQKLHLRARDIPLTPVAESIQKYVEKTVFQAASGHSKDVSSRVVVRTVSNVRREQESTPGFTARYGKKKFPYQLKNIIAFIECDDGTDVAFLSLVVAEFGADAPAPNTNKAYLSYVDSVHLYHQKKCLLRKGSALCTSTCSNPEACMAERKMVVRRVILGYLDSIRRRGFDALYIWVMPPNDLHHDYIFHMRPISQHCPKPVQLDSWYTKLLTVAKDEGIIADFDSNAQEEGDDEQDRTLPKSLFGPDMSLRNVPQFPGGEWGYCPRAVAQDVHACSVC